MVMFDIEPVQRFVLAALITLFAAGGGGASAAPAHHAQASAGLAPGFCVAATGTPGSGGFLASNGVAQANEASLDVIAIGWSTTQDRLQAQISVTNLNDNPHGGQMFYGVAAYYDITFAANGQSYDVFASNWSTGGIEAGFNSPSGSRPGSYDGSAKFDYGASRITISIPLDKIGLKPGTTIEGTTGWTASTDPHGDLWDVIFAAGAIPAAVGPQNPVYADTNINNTATYVIGGGCAKA